MSDSGSILEVPADIRPLRSNVALRLRLIGQMEAWTLNSESVLPVGRKTRALLAILALSAPRPMIRARLAELLWSRRLEEQARASLRQEIHRLLDTLQPVGVEVIRVTRDHLSLRTDVVWVDVEEVMRATPSDPTALALLDGELLDEFNGIDPALDQWLASERERLRDRARLVAEARLNQISDPETVIGAAQRLLTIDRAHEGGWRALMRAHAERGERGLAVQAYERCRAALADLLDASPSPETQRLAAEIRAGAVSPPPPPRAELLRTELKPTIRGGAKVGVLPLRMVGTGEEEAHLSLGLAEEITAALARFRWMFLVSSSSLAQFGNRDETALRRTFGLDFLLDGGVQKVNRRLRVTARLLDLRDGNRIVWARHFDRQVNDLLSLQDEIAAEVVAQIDPEILLIEGRRAASAPPHDSSAYDLVLRALPLIIRLRRDEFLQAGALLDRALELEPDYAAANAWRAYWAMFSIGQGWNERDDAIDEAGRYAERAIALDPQDARALTIAGHVRAYLHQKPREALELHGRALSLNPNLAMAWGLSALTYTYIGDVDEATRRFARYKRLSPMDPNAFFFDASMVQLELQNRNYDQAVQLGRRSSELNPQFTAGLKHYLCALGHSGLTEEAAQVRERLLAIEPGFNVKQALLHIPYEDPAESEHYAAGLRLAGVAEGA
jgi:DNA-binding SARP family transcriptional activator/tetratricopeptide (TPR) repeat protein